MAPRSSRSPVSAFDDRPRWRGVTQPPGARPGSIGRLKVWAYTGAVVEPSQRPGADLASSEDVRSLEAADRGQWYRARALSAHLTAARGRQAWLASVAVFVGAGLAGREYPTWLVVGVGAQYAVSLVFYHAQLEVDS